LPPPRRAPRRRSVQFVPPWRPGSLGTGGTTTGSTLRATLNRIWTFSAQRDVHVWRGGAVTFARLMASVCSGSAFRRASQAAALLAMPATAATPVPLQQRLDAAKSNERQLRGAVGADNAQIAGFQSRIDDVRQRLVGLESSLAVEQRLLEASRAELRVARGRLQVLRLRYARARTVLAQQLVGDYKADRPDFISVILDAHGFADLLERADALRAVARRNTQYTTTVRDTRTAVRHQAVRLKAVTARRRQIARATLLQTQEVSELRTTLVNRQLQFIRARDHKTAKLSTVRARRRQIEQRLNVIEARAARVAVGSLPSGLGGGAYGFFPAAGTNYNRGRRAPDRRPARPPRQGAQAPPHRALGLPHPAALGRGRRVRQRPAHARAGIRHAGGRGRPRGDAQPLRPHAPVRRRARGQPHPAGLITARPRGRGASGCRACGTRWRGASRPS